MTYKQKVKIHDAMKIIHSQFMQTARSLKTRCDDIQEVIDDVNSLMGMMKNLAMLLEKALELD